jgi:hypothetical protein
MKCPGCCAREATLANAPPRKLSQPDINAETMRAMEKYSQQWLDAIGRHAPSFLRSTLRDGAPVVGSKHYQGLQAGTTTYRIYLFVKD